MSQRCLAAVVSGFVLVLLAAPAAGASTIVGSSLLPSAAGRCNTNVCTAVQTSGGSGTIQAPTSGVIVAFRIKHGPVTPTTATVGFKVLSGSGPSFTHVVQTRQFPFAPENRAAGGITTVSEVDANGRPRGVPIAGGQRIAAVVQDASGDPSQSVHFIANQPGATVGVVDLRPRRRAPRTTTQVTNFEVLINGTLEPDADEDGYGDESQDNCTTVANDQSSNPCIGPPPPPPPPPGDPVLGRSFVVEPVNGQTFVKGGSGAFELLTRPRRLRIRSLVDTRAGTARIRTARNRRGTLQSGDFFGGLFQVLQSRKRRARGLTELHLKGSSFSNCEAEASSRGRARLRVTTQPPRRARAGRKLQRALPDASGATARPPCAARSGGRSTAATARSPGSPAAGSPSASSAARRRSS